VLLEPTELGAHLVEGVIPFPGVALQFLLPANEDPRAPLEKAWARKQQREKNHRVQRATTYPEDAPRWTAVDPQRLVQRPVDRSAVITELLP
jgi:hypothetical protein